VKMDSQLTRLQPAKVLLEEYGPSLAERQRRLRVMVSAVSKTIGKHANDFKPYQKPKNEFYTIENQERINPISYLECNFKIASSHDNQARDCTRDRALQYPQIFP